MRFHRSVVGAVVSIVLFGWSTLMAFESPNPVGEGSSVAGDEITIQPGHLSFPVDSLGLVGELSKKGVGEAYPTISPDGLRLYYTRVGQESWFATASRRSVAEPFGEGERMDLELDGLPTGEAISSWVTPDETEAYFFLRASDELSGAKTTLFRAERVDKWSKWTLPEKVDLVGNLEGFLSAPSLTRDGRFLYVYSASNGGRILEFKRDQDGSYLLVGPLPIPADLTVGPGQLSKDDLYYYVEVKNEDEDEILGRYERRYPDEPFATLTILRSELNKGMPGIHHPTITEDGSTIVFVRSPNHTWEGNDLYVSRRDVESDRDRLSGIEESDAGRSLQVFPNPVSSRLTVVSSESMDQSGEFVVWSEEGKEVLRAPITVGSTAQSLDVSSLPNGAYLIRIESKGGEHSPVHRFVVHR